MKIHRLLAIVSLLLASVSPLAAQFSIPRYTVDSGGGKSTGGTFALTGTIGQPDASTPSTGGNYALTGGFWPAAEASLTGGFAAWASTNIPAGHDASFAGDWNSDGVSNGIDYALGSTAYALVDAGSLFSPTVPVPADVTLRLLYSDDLDMWETRAEWAAGAAPVLEPGVSIDAGVLTDLLGGTEPRGYWRYEAELLP